LERLRRENELLRRQLEERAKQIADQAREIDDLKRQLALNNRIPPSPRSRRLLMALRVNSGSGGAARRADGKPAGSPAIRDVIVSWCPSSASMRL
jgi:hypothetical protein